MEAEDLWKVSSLPRHVSRDSHFVLSKSGISEVFESLGTANRTSSVRLQKQVTERKLADELPSMMSELLVSMSAVKSAGHPA